MKTLMLSALLCGALTLCGCNTAKDGGSSAPDGVDTARTGTQTTQTRPDQGVGAGMSRTATGSDVRGPGAGNNAGGTGTLPAGATGAETTAGATAGINGTNDNEGNDVNGQPHAGVGANDDTSAGADGATPGPSRSPSATEP